MEVELEEIELEALEMVKTEGEMDTEKTEIELVETELVLLEAEMRIEAKIEKSGVRGRFPNGTESVPYSRREDSCRQTVQTVMIHVLILRHQRFKRGCITVSKRVFNGSLHRLHQSITDVAAKRPEVP